MQNSFTAFGEYVKLHPRPVKCAFLLAFAFYAAMIRFDGIREHFYFFGDQCLAWDYVGRPFGQLPFFGASTTDGMYGWGPIYYWWVWLIRAVVGPWYGDMPVATALPMGMLCIAGETFLIFALLRRKTPWPACLAYALFALSSSYFNSLAVQPWAPPFAFALLNFAIGSTLLIGSPVRPWQAAVIAALCVFATQGHPAALVVSCGIFAYLAVDALRNGSARLAAAIGLTIIGTIFLLETPYLATRILQPELFNRKSEAVRSLSQIIANPLLISPSRGFSFVFDVSRQIFLGWLSPWLSAAALAAATLAIVLRRGFFRPEVYVSIVPLLGAAFGFSLYLTVLNKYWLVIFASCLYLTYVFGLIEPLGASRRAVFRGAAWALVALLALQHAGSLAEPLLRYPYYGIMERAAFRLAREGREIRGLLPPEIDAYEKTADSRNFNLLARWAGVKIDPAATYYAVVDQDGAVHFMDGPLPDNRRGFPDGSLEGQAVGMDHSGDTR